MTLYIPIRMVVDTEAPSADGKVQILLISSGSLWVTGMPKLPEDAFYSIKTSVCPLPCV